MRSSFLPLAAASLLAAALPCQSLTTTFSSNAGSSSFWISPSVSFDIDVTNPAGVVIDSLEVNTPYVGIPGTLELYTTAPGGTRVGNEIAPAVGTWLLRATGSIVTAGTDTPVAVPLSKPVHLPFGTQGVYIVHRGCGVRYTNGAQLTYGNADMTITMGAAQATAFTSTLNAPRIANVTLNYSAPADTVDFTADVVSGPSPLTVAFTDRSGITSGPVLLYEWDFDGDGTFDSTSQNDSFTYTQCGDYSPKLRVTTASGQVEYAWPNMIAVDPLVADFIATPETGAPPSLVQFSDASVGATLWLWDFDSDGNVDDTTQNPSFTFDPGSYKVTLTVGNGCRLTSVTKRVDSVTDSWTTNYTAGNNLIAKQALAFVDITTTSTESLIVTAIDVNTIVHRSNPCPVKIWITEGSANGNQQNADAWREIASGTGISPGGNNPTRIALDRPFVLLPGRTYGLAINYLDCQAYYNSPGSASMSHPDFTIDFWGVNTATTPFSTTPTTRQWNGTLHYVKSGTWPVGAITPYGLGCAGSLGTPRATPAGSSRAKLGTTLSVEVDRMPIGVGLMVLGFNVGPPLPIDLSFLGMPGCRAHIGLEFAEALISLSNTANFSAALPNDPTLAGTHLYMQALVLDPGFNAFEAVMSDALAALLAVY